MNRKDIIETVAIATGMTKGDAAKAWDAIWQDIAFDLIEGGDVGLPGIGRLYLDTTKAGTGRNPRTGEPIDIPAGYRVKFAQAVPMKRRLAALSPPPAQAAE